MTEKNTNQIVLEESSREFLQQHSEQTLRIAAKKEQELFDKKSAIDYYFFAMDAAQQMINAIKKHVKTK